MAEVLMEFPELTMEVGDRQEPIMKRTTLVANTSNMPVAAREASIYTGITLSEYFRDQEGQDVLLFIDNIFRFTQAGSEVSALLGRIPSAVGYQPTLSTDMGGMYVFRLFRSAYVTESHGCWTRTQAGAHHHHQEGFHYIRAGCLRACR